MFNELLKLTKLLFKSKLSEMLDKDLEIVVMLHFLFKGYRFMSWCDKVITRVENKDVINRFLETKAGRITITHEYGHMVHV